LEVVPPLAGATIGRGLRQLFDTDGGHVSLTGFVAGMLDDDPERYDAPTVVEAYRARINGVLPAGLVLVGDDLYAQDDTEWDAYEFRMAVNDLDLFAIADDSLGERGGSMTGPNGPEPRLALPLHLGPALPRRSRTLVDVRTVISDGTLRERHWLDAKAQLGTSEGARSGFAKDLVSFANDGGRC
jgi:hypothetical protein